MTDRASEPVLQVNDCWNRIGVRGDRSCPELLKYVHCRNCPVYAARGADLLNGALTADYLVERTARVAHPLDVAVVLARSVVIFRVGAEWLALPTPVIAEVTNVLSVHSLPHRRDGVVLGLANVRGQLLVCVSLGRVVSAEPLPPGIAAPRAKVSQRLLIIRSETARLVCPVDEVHGIHRFHPGELVEVPTTVATSAVTYSTGLLPWRGHWVGVLDDELVFRALKRSLA